MAFCHYQKRMVAGQRVRVPSLELVRVWASGQLSLVVDAVIYDGREYPVSS